MWSTTIIQKCDKSPVTHAGCGWAVWECGTLLYTNGHSRWHCSPLRGLGWPYFPSSPWTPAELRSPSGDGAPRVGETSEKEQRRMKQNIRIITVYATWVSGCTSKHIRPQNLNNIKDRTYFISQWSTAASPSVTPEWACFDVCSLVTQHHNMTLEEGGETFGAQLVLTDSLYCFWPPIRLLRTSWWWNLVQHHSKCLWPGRSLNTTAIAMQKHVGHISLQICRHIG